MPTKCPICGEIVGAEVKNKFHHCLYCNVLVRAEKDMPCYPGRFNYDYQWAQDQEDEHNYAKGLILIDYITKLSDVKTVLDVGCGPGAIVGALNCVGCVASGYDISGECLRYAKEHYPGNFYSYSERHLLPEFDLVILDNVIEHIPNPTPFINWLYSLVRPKGYIYVATPNLRNRWLTGTEQPDHRVIYSPEALKRVFKKQDFDTIMLRTKTFGSFLPSAIFNTMTDSKPLGETTGPWRAAVSIYHKLANSYAGKLALGIACKLSEMGNRGSCIIMVVRKK